MNPLSERKAQLARTYALLVNQPSTDALRVRALAAASRERGGLSLVRDTTVPRLHGGAVYDKGLPSNHPAVTTISLETTPPARARRS